MIAYEFVIAFEAFSALSVFFAANCRMPNKSSHRPKGCKTTRSNFAQCSKSSREAAKNKSEQFCSMQQKSSRAYTQVSQKSTFRSA